MMLRNPGRGTASRKIEARQGARALNQCYDFIERLLSSSWELRVFIKHGSLTLSMTVRNGCYEYCTQQLIELADGVLRALVEEQACVAREISRVAGAEQAVE